MQSKLLKLYTALLLGYGISVFHTQDLSYNVLSQNVNSTEILSDTIKSAMPLTQTNFITPNRNTVSDIDGNTYNVIKIGNQEWMGRNLKTTKLNDAIPIAQVNDNSEWQSFNKPAFCWYKNQSIYGTAYGALYNWQAVETKKLCPLGWHIPSQEEWTVLITYLGGENQAGGKLKEKGTSDWYGPNTAATDEAGFSALPGGTRQDDGTFYDIHSAGFWWTSTEYRATYAWYRSMDNKSSKIHNYNYSRQGGLSVRCIKD